MHSVPKFEHEHSSSEESKLRETDPLAVSISDAIRIVGLGRTSLYAAIAAGKLKTRKCGRRTLVEVAALRQFIENLPESGA
jgi:Helix-turn-helix domain